MILFWLLEHQKGLNSVGEYTELEFMVLATMRIIRPEPQVTKQCSILAETLKPSSDHTNHVSLWLRWRWKLYTFKKAKLDTHDTKESFEIGSHRSGLLRMFHEATRL